MVMQAEGEVVQLHEATGRSRDFRTLYEDEHRSLFQTLYFVTGDRHEAADLMHEAFLKMWERWDSIGEIRDVHAYLFKVALNSSRMRMRSARLAARRRVPLGVVHDPFDEVELREDVRQMLLALTPGNVPPSSCSTCTTTTQGRPHGSWASGHRPFAPSPRKAGPLSAFREAPMPDLREVFEMVKQQTEPDQDSWSEQERRIRQSQRKRKYGAIALVAALIVVIAIVVASNLDADDQGGVAPASSGPSIVPPGSAGRS